MPTICWYRPFLLALAHCGRGWLWVHYPLVSSIYINLTLCMVLYIIFIDYIICSCMWITYLSTKSAFLSLEELLNIAIDLVPVPSRCLRYAHLKWLLTVLGRQRARPRLICAIHVVRWLEVSRAAACAYFDTRSRMVSMAMNILINAHALLTVYLIIRF